MLTVSTGRVAQGLPGTSEDSLRLDNDGSRIGELHVHEVSAFGTIEEGFRLTSQPRAADGTVIFCRPWHPFRILRPPCRPVEGFLSNLAAGGFAGSVVHMAARAV